MFVSAVSTKAADSVKPDDVALGLSIGDLSPATFRVEFDEPIRLKNADIELVACKVAKRNEIIINDGNNSLTVRMGDSSVAEQYVAKIPHGSYTEANLGIAIAEALNDVMPMNIYKGAFSTSIVANKIKITYTVQNAPNAVVFQDHAKFAGNEEPIPFLKSDDGDYVEYVCEDSQKAQNRSPYRIPSDIWEYCGNVDAGSRMPDNLTRVGIDEFGIWEGRRGLWEAILQPVECCTKSTFDAGFGGFGGGNGKPTYFTFEFERNVDEDGNTVDGLYKYGGMFNSNTMQLNTPRQYIPGGREFINGVLNVTKDINDIRGAPYNINHKMVFPYCANPKVNGNDKFTRKNFYDTTWDGCIKFRKTSGKQGQVPQVPDSYSFQMDNINVGSDHKARCLAKRVGFATDRVRIRPTAFPLIQGLPQTTAANGDEVDTFCAVVPPLVVNPVNIKYKVGSVGQLNSRAFGQTFLANNTQCLHTATGPNGEDQYKLPFYKILSINPDGSPNEVVLVDSGERVIEFDPTDATTVQNTSFYFNDPNTWEEITNSGDSEDTIMETQIFRIEPDLSQIGSGPTFLEQATAKRILPFNIGLMRDDIYQSLKANLPPVPYGSQPNPLALPKDIEIDVYSNINNSSGAAVGPNNTIGVTIHQMQPSTDRDSDNTVFSDTQDVRRCLFQATSGTWSGAAGSGPAMANWTTFPGVTSPGVAVKISISMRDTYTQQIYISHCNNYVNTSSTFTESVLLSSTNITRGGAGGVVKNRSTIKTRFAPYHPVMSPLPMTIFEKNKVLVKCIGSIYPERNVYYKSDNLVSFQNNYEANQAFMAKGDFQAPQNVFPDPEPPGEKCVMMIKSKKLIPSQISPGPAPPPAGNTDLCVIEDFSPDDGATMYNAGLHSVMYAQVTALNNDVDFPQDTIPIKQPFLPSFAVEIQNLPLSGYIGKGFDEGKITDRKGLGSRLPIVGIVPATEFPASFDQIVNYHYKTPYYQPTQVRLPTEQFLYNLDINLRNIVTGKLLQDLIHSSEVILRIYNLPD